MEQMQAAELPEPQAAQFLEEEENAEADKDLPDPCKVKPFDIEFWKYQNMMRTDPKKFTSFLADYKKRFNGKMVTLPGGMRMMTREGAHAPQNLINYLNTAKPRQPLRFSTPLWKAALGFVKEQGPTGQLGHVGPHGSTFISRINA